MHQGGQAVTVGDLLERSTQRSPAAAALVCGDARLTYAGLLDVADRLGAGLRLLGLAPGDRVGLLLHNSQVAMELVLALGRAGLVFVPLNYMLNSRELAAIIAHAGVRAVVTEPDLHPVLRPVLAQLDCVEHLVGVGEVEGATASYASLLRQGAEVPGPGPGVGPEDLFGLMYTSGTTGLPKGVMLTHANITAHARHMVRDYRIGPRSRGLVVLPYFVGAALNGIAFPCLSRGGTVVVLPRFTPRAFLQAVESERITHAQVVPTLLVRLLASEDLGQYDTGSLELLGYGSAPMPLACLRRAIKVLGPVLAQMYGLTETCAMATCLRPEEHVLRGPGAGRLRSCGRPVEGVEVRIVNEAGDEVDEGEMGEVAIRGATVMRGYWEMPELTAEAMRGGWFHSGDLGYRDEEGFVFLGDRKKDMIISGGFNVFPREVEEVLYTHPAVFECAVIGVPHPEWGEAVEAVVALREGSRASAEELLAFCRDRLSSFKRPRAIGFVDEIPRNPSGKVLKRVLRRGRPGNPAGEAPSKGEGNEQ